MLKNLFTKPRKIIDSLFAGTALLIIIPIIILGISLTWIFSSGFMKQTDRININTVDYVVELLVENLNMVYNTAYILGSDSSIMKYWSHEKSSYEYAENLREIETTISRQQLQSDFIKEIYIFYRDSKFVINGNDDKFKTQEKLIEYYGMSLDELTSFLPENNMKFIRSKVKSSAVNSDVLLSKCIDQRFKAEGNIYAIYVLNGEVISNLIDMINLEDVGHSLILDAEYNLLLGNDEIYQRYETKLKEMQTGKGAGIDSHVLLKEVENDKLNLCFVVDDSHYVSMIKYIWNVIGCIGIAVIVVSIYISRFYIRRLYRPFGNIVNMFKPEEEEYVIKSELEFFEEKYIEIKNMKEELGEYKNSEDIGLREMFFHNFLKGFYATDYKQYMQDMNIAFETAYYTTVLVKIDNFKNITQNIKLSHYRKFIKDKLLEILEGQGLNKHAGIEPFYFYDGEYIGLLICHNEILEKFLHVIFDVQRELFKMLKITVSVCVGDTTENPEELIEEYKDLSNAMMQMKFCNPETVLTMQDYRKIGKYVDFSQYKKRIVQYISDRNYEQLNVLIDEVFIQSNIFYTEIIQLVTGFLTIITELLDKTGGRTFFINGNEIHPYDEIGRMGTVSEIANYMKKLCKDVGDKLYTENSGKRDMYNKFIAYIAANYMKEITLTSMSKAFGLSSSYFSRCFKETTGKNYSEMINSYRVEKAKELISTEEEIKMFQIAELVGFTSYKAFAEAFKKYTGISPESYRKSRNEQNSFEI